MPWFVICIAIAFTGIDTFTDFDVTDSEMTLLYAILTPFGLGGLVKSGYEFSKKVKTDTENFTAEDKMKLEELLKKVGIKT